MRQIEIQIDSSIREHYETKMTELNSEFDRIMINKDNKAKNDKETYESQLDEIIKSIDNKEQEHNENIKQLTDEKMKYFNENQNL